MKFRAESKDIWIFVIFCFVGRAVFAFEGIFFQQVIPVVGTGV